MTDETARLRRTLAAQLIAVIAADFERKGAEAVERLREKDPSAYLRAVMSLTADAPPAGTTLETLTDVELDRTLAYVADAIREQEAAGGGEAPPPEREQARTLSPLSETAAVS